MALRAIQAAACGISSCTIAASRHRADEEDTVLSRNTDAVLRISDIAGGVLTAAGLSLTLFTRLFLYRSDSAGLFVDLMSVAAAALFPGTAFLGYSAFRRGFLGRVLLAVPPLLVALFFGGNPDAALAAAIPAGIWTVVLGAAAVRDGKLQRRFVASLLIGAACLVLPLGYYVPVMLAPLGGLGSHGGLPHASPSCIAVFLIPAALLFAALTALAVFILQRKKTASPPDSA